MQRRRAAHALQRPAHDLERRHPSTPAILQRSGVGAPGLLAQLAIPLVATSPEVGENLLEHTIITLQWRAKGYSNNAHYRGLGALLSGMRY